MNTPTYLTETTSDNAGTFDTYWHCPVPADGVRYRVVEQAWTDDISERHIYRIEVV